MSQTQGLREEKGQGGGDRREVSRREDRGQGGGEYPGRVSTGVRGNKGCREARRAVRRRLLKLGVDTVLLLSVF